MQKQQHPLLPPSPPCGHETRQWKHGRMRWCDCWQVVAGSLSLLAPSHLPPAFCSAMSRKKQSKEGKEQAREKEREHQKIGILYKARPPDLKNQSHQFHRFIVSHVPPSILPLSVPSRLFP